MVYKFPLHADFQNIDPEGRIRLNTTGTSDDLARQKRTLSVGQQVQLYTDDGDSDRGLAIAGTVKFSSSEGVWVAAVDWSLLVRKQAVSEMPRPAAPASPNRDRLAPSHL